MLGAPRHGWRRVGARGQEQTAVLRLREEGIDVGLGLWTLDYDYDRGLWHGVRNVWVCRWDVCVL
jgi:hypothetical protein